jgi:predicted nucleotidyltransferase
MLTRKSADRLIQQFICALWDSGIPVEKAILFGSYVKGGVHEGSDIDLAIWSSTFKGWSGMDTLDFSLILANHWPISVKTFHSRETKNDDPFIEEIEKTGKQIDLGILKKEYLKVKA